MIACLQDANKVEYLWLLEAFNTQSMNYPRPVLSLLDDMDIVGQALGGEEGQEVIVKSNCKAHLQLSLNQPVNTTL